MGVMTPTVYADAYADAYIVCTKNASAQWKRSFVALLRSNVPHIAKYKRDETVLRLIRYPVRVLKRTRKQTTIAFDKAGTKRATLLNTRVFLSTSYAINANLLRKTTAKYAQRGGGDEVCARLWVQQVLGTCWFNAIINCFLMSGELRNMVLALMMPHLITYTTKYNDKATYTQIHNTPHPDIAKMSRNDIFRLIMFVSFVPGFENVTKQNIVTTSANAYHAAFYQFSGHNMFQVFTEICSNVFSDEWVLPKNALHLNLCSYMISQKDQERLQDQNTGYYSKYHASIAKLCENDPYLYIETTGVDRINAIPYKYLYSSESKIFYILTCATIEIHFKEKKTADGKDIHSHAVAGIYCAGEYFICDSNTHNILYPSNWDISDFASYIDNSLEHYDGTINTMYLQNLVYVCTLDKPEKGATVADIDTFTATRYDPEEQ